MEINITALIERSDDMHYYSASQMELGHDAGRITWQNAVDAAEESPVLTTPEQIAALREHVVGMGASDCEDLTDAEYNALFLQLVAGDIREAGEDLTEDYEAYQAAAEAGQISGNIFRCDIEGHESFGEWFYYLGC